jgi:hypothetical protein
MKFEISITGLVLVTIILIMAAPAEADVEPNETPGTSEVIGRGTHQGRVDYMTSGIDCYRVENIGDNKVTITGTMKDPKMEEYISILTVDEYGTPDYQTEIYLSSEYTSDTCHWEDPGDRGVMYVIVEGTGDYELKIEFGDESDDDEIAVLGAPLLLVMVGGICALALIILIIIIIVILFLMRSRPSP